MPNSNKNTTSFKYLLVGNPNCGKSSLFNRLTGLRQKTGNFSGVTVEKKIGILKTTQGDVELWDLPGSYSLEGNSEDRKLTSREILSRNNEDRIVFIMDALQLERSFQFLTSLIDTGAKLLVVLTMKDLLLRRGISIDLNTLENQTGLQFHLINAKSGEGVEDLKKILSHPTSFRIGKRIWKWAKKEEQAWSKLLSTMDISEESTSRFAIQKALLGSEEFISLFPQETQDHIRTIAAKNHFTAQEELVSKSIFIKQIISQSITYKKQPANPRMERADRILLHPIYGLGIFIGIMVLIFQFLFTWAELPMEWIENGISTIQNLLGGILPSGPVSALLIDGALAGVGSVLVFIPQISLLFFFIGIMEESGYMARVSFVMDRIMGKFGLSGKSFIPLLSSAACAVPAIMGARTIENKSDRMTTIMIAPLVMCSARYPVYILVIGTVFASGKVFGIFHIQGLVLFSLFFLGLITSLLFGLLFKRTLFREASSYFIMELPSYKMPSFISIFQNVFAKVKTFLKNAGQIILYISILLWFISYYPIQYNQDGAIETNIKSSYAGSIGRAIEPIIEPLGFDWKIGISLITSFAAREVMVSTLAVIYEVEGGDEESPGLRQAMLNDRRSDGSPLWDPITGFSILVFFAFASQCMSTLAVVRRETNSYIWPSFQFAYMTGLAYISSLAVYQIGKLLF
jgi:ferrous iron transport protein B